MQVGGRCSAGHAGEPPALEGAPVEHRREWLDDGVYNKTNDADIDCIAYWIAFGPHGPRAETPPGEGRKVFSYTLIGVLAGFAIFALTHLSAGPHPSTMNREWQEKTNEYFKVRTMILRNWRNVLN